MLQMNQKWINHSFGELWLRKWVENEELIKLSYAFLFKAHVKTHKGATEVWTSFIFFLKLKKWVIRMPLEQIPKLISLEIVFG